MRPYEFDDLLSILIFDNVVSPGVVTISGLADAENWKIAEAKGSTGASTTLEGKAPREFTATIYIADDSESGDEFERWNEFRAKVDSTTSGAKPKALPIYHPDLARATITEASKRSVQGPVYDGRGGATYTVEFIEYKPPKPKPPARAKAKAAGTSGAKDTYDPNAAAKAELDSLIAEAKRPL